MIFKDEIYCPECGVEQNIEYNPYWDNIKNCKKCGCKFKITIQLFAEFISKEEKVWEKKNNTKEK